jgi:hypothetical protein
VQPNKLWDRACNAETKVFQLVKFSMVYITHMVFTLLAAKWQPYDNQLATKPLPATAKYRVDN